MKDLERKAEFFKSLGDITRLKILDYLINNDEVCICDIAKQVKKDQSTVFRHMQILKSAGIIKTTKENKFLMCCIEHKKQLKRCIETTLKC